MESIIVIATKENKDKILRDNSKQKKLVNLKFYTFLELKRYLFFDYDVNAIAFLVKNYGISVAVAKMYLENMYFLKDIANSKVQFLREMKQRLDEEGLLIYHEHFWDTLKKKKIIVYGFEDLTKEQKLILDKIDAFIEYSSWEEKKYVPKVYEAKNMEEEVEFGLIEIAKLLENNISINNIKVIASKEYDNLLNRYFSLYDIPYNKKNNHAFYSTMVAQEFLSNYNLYSIEENIMHLSEKYTNVSQLVKIINASVLIQDKDLRKEFIIQDLKKTKIPEVVYLNAVKITDLKDAFSDDDYVFLLGFNVNQYPVIKRDIDYLSDQVREQLGLDTTVDENNYEANFVLYKIQHIKNLVITYKLHSFSKEDYPSMLISELDLEVLPIKLDASCTYSLKYSNMKYALSLDNLYKFGSMDPNLGIYEHNLDIPYNSYDNQFKGISTHFLKKKLQSELTLSYTNLEMYQECAFRYYVSKILRLDIFLENFKTILGSIMHHVLELGIMRDIDIPVEMMKFVKEKGYILNAKEMFYLEEFSHELTDILEVIRMQHKKSKLKHYLFEQEFFVYKDLEDFNITFKGNIDKVMYETIKDKEVLAVVDYKTGNPTITLNNLDYGLNIQLPIYLYLLKRSDRFKNSLIAGFYIQKILTKKEPIQFKKSLHELLKNRLRLQGFTNSDEELMGILDEDYQKGEILANVQFKKDGLLSSKAKVLSNEEMDELISKVDKIIDGVIQKILDANFVINPKVINGKNIACTYCKFRDLCYRRKKNEVELGGEIRELDERAAVSN